MRVGGGGAQEKGRRERVKLTLQTLLLDSSTLLAMTLPCTSPLAARYFKPSATCCEKLRSILGVTLNIEPEDLPDLFMWRNRGKSIKFVWSICL